MIARVLQYAALAATLVAAPAGARGFVAIEVADVETVSTWYARTFGLSEVKRLEVDAAKVVVLDGEPLIVEIIERTDQPPRHEGRSLGFAKAGAEMSDLDAAVARWREDGVQFFGHGETFYDAEMDRRTTILLDPEGNRVQVFSRLCGGDETAVACR